MRNPKSQTYDQVAARREREGKGKPRRCPKCKNGAGLLISNIEAGGDGEIYERVFCCSWCQYEWTISHNPYVDE